VQLIHVQTFKINVYPFVEVKIVSYYTVI